MTTKLYRFLLVILLLPGCARQPELTTYYPVPDFSLIDQTGKPATLHDFAGKVWIADFIFTNCGGTCPLMTEQMRKVYDAVPREIRMVSFSVDPVRDTPKVLADYAKAHGVDREGWIFLTGDKSALHDLSLNGFKLPLDETGGTSVEPITHSTRFVLVDRKGHIRGYYSGTEEDDLKRLTADAKRLL